MTVFRKILSVAAGALAAGLVIAGVEAAGHALARGEAVFAIAMVGYGLGAGTGSLIAALMADRTCAAIVTGILAVLATINVFAFPHPLWFAPTAIIVLLLGWALGSTAAAMRRPTGEQDQ